MVPDHMIRVAILGSTGSVGEQGLDVIRLFPHRFEVVGLAAGGRVGRLRDQALEFRPRYLACRDGRDAGALHLEARAWGGSIVSLEEMATAPEVDVVLVATTGLASLRPTIAALKAGKKVAIANKETLVVGGHAVRAALDEGRALGAEIRPVDSEHSAIWQCLWGEAPESIATLTLTASGGAFRDYDLRALEGVTAQEALQHPTWQMGPKITVDSATLFNKGLEVIEARWLFDIPLDRVEVLQHRESVIHSMVTFRDGSVKAQLGEPDLRLPVQVALLYPERGDARPAPPLDLAKRGALHFGEVDRERFPVLDIAIEAGRRDDTSAAAVSGADESAVAHFLAARIRFTDIARLLQQALDAHHPTAGTHLTLDDLLAAEQWGRDFVDQAVAAGVS